MSALTIAMALWGGFLTAMVVGLVLQVLSLFVRRRGSVLGARLLLTGPAGGFLAAAVFILGTEVALPAKLLLVAMFGVSGIAIFAYVLRSRITLREVQF